MAHLVGQRVAHLFTVDIPASADGETEIGVALFEGTVTGWSEGSAEKLSCTFDDGEVLDLEVADAELCRQLIHFHGGSGAPVPGEASQTYQSFP